MDFCGDTWKSVQFFYLVKCLNQHKWWKLFPTNIDRWITLVWWDLFSVLERPLQFICVTSLSSKRFSEHLWLRVITKSVKKKKHVISLTDCKLKSVFPLQYKPPEYRPINFVVCPYIPPGRINGILWYIKNLKVSRNLP